MAALFGPVAERIGTQLAKAAESMMHVPLNATETNNLKAHAASVKKKTGEITREPTRKQQKELVTWMDDASDTDPRENHEESAKWQAILDEILGRNDETSIDAMKSLNIYDIKALSSLERDGGKLSGSQASRFVSKEIVERQNMFDNVRVVAVGAIAILMLVLSINLELLYSIFKSEALFTALRTALMFGSLTLFGSLFMLYLRTHNQVELTDLGKDIKTKIDYFMKKRDD